MMWLAKFLGQKASNLLEAEPFKNWPVERSVSDDSDPPEVGYTFVGCGLEMKCDRFDERINCLFIKEESCAGTFLSEVPFHLRRDEVLARFGAPSDSRERLTHPLLGDYGPADQFRGLTYTTHVEYEVDADSIKMITLMRNDVVPAYRRHF